MPVELEWTVAIVTLVGFPIAILGLFFTWRQAVSATEAADSAKEAVASTTSRMATMELANEFARVRESMRDVEIATNNEDPGVAELVLRRLASSLQRSVALARSDASPDVSEELIDALEAASRRASRLKAAIVKDPIAKVRTRAQGLLDELDALSHRLIAFETQQQYELPQEG